MVRAKIMHVVVGHYDRSSRYAHVYHQERQFHKASIAKNHLLKNMHRTEMKVACGGIIPPLASDGVSENDPFII